MTTTGAYRVADIRDATTTYIFNVCDVTAPPTTNPTNACVTGNRGRNALPATGWQVENDGNSKPDNCYRLGGNQTNGWNFTLFGEPARVSPAALAVPGRRCAAVSLAPRRRSGVPSQGRRAHLPCR